MVYEQSHNHWTRSFNEESSLLSGAVVGGGAGPSAIYYNPASISEITESKFSLHASLFSFDFLNMKNALGDGIDLNFSRGAIEPRFVSYMVKPKNHQEWSLEFAFLNNERYHMDLTQSVDKKMDVLQGLPGEERYYSFFRYQNIYRDDWIGFGGSIKLNSSLSIGASMFLSVKSLKYSYNSDIEVFPLDSVFVDGEYIPFYSASYEKAEYLRFNDYRLLWKLGMLWKKDRFSLGFNITTPSLGGIYSDGKEVMHKEKQSNITFPETGEPLPNHIFADYSEKNDVYVNAKSPMSIALGFTWFTLDKTKKVFATIEYFDDIEPYKMVEAKESPWIATGSDYGGGDFNDWLSFTDEYKGVLNAGIGYRWNVKKDLEVLTGFRTDFNYRKKLEELPNGLNKQIRGLDIDLYHFTGGLSWRVLGQDIMIGLQYTLGREKKQKQFINLSDPVEYNMEEMLPLQGTRQNNMSVSYNSISIYFGATFNFGGGNSKQ